MKKSIFSLAALMMLAITGLTSCGNIDDSVYPERPIVFPKGDFEVTQKFTSINEIGTTPFLIIDVEAMKAFYGPDNQNLAFDDIAKALVKTNANIAFKLEAVGSNYLLRAITPAGAEYNIWGSPGYLNSQTADGWCSFILGLNNQYGQDLENGALWDIQYVDGKGFTLKSVATGKYLKDNSTAKFDEPTYFQFYGFKEAVAEPQPQPEEPQGQKVTIWEGEFTATAWDAASLRFSDTEGLNFPYLSDEVYFGLKKLIVDVKEASEGCTGRVMNGWWSSTYADNVALTSGMKWEIQITEDIANECAKGGDAKDLNLLITNGEATFTGVYYYE
ncbi:MAG: hypothetical protein IJU33_00545 [Bacteroidales bacterium]|nr:hypothetical protein [Bacteroidales bacterium]